MPDEQEKKPVAVYVPAGEKPPEGFMTLKQSGLNRKARRSVQARIGRKLRRSQEGKRSKHMGGKKPPLDVGTVMEELVFGKD